jgi:hypothetical protein
VTFSAEQVPVSAYVGSSKNLKNLRPKSSQTYHRGRERDLHYYQTQRERERERERERGRERPSLLVVDILQIFTKLKKDESGQLGEFAENYQFRSPREGNLVSNFYENFGGPKAPRVCPAPGHSKHPLLTSFKGNTLNS